MRRVQEEQLGRLYLRMRVVSYEVVRVRDVAQLQFYTRHWRARNAASRMICHGQYVSTGTIL